MHTSPEHEDPMFHNECGCGHCDEHEDSYDDDVDLYDDPYEVVMYDIDGDSDDLFALIEMLSDSARSWFAKRRLNSLAAAGPLSALVADIIIDSLGRRWDPLLHPRDRYGQFINTGGFFRWLVRGAWNRGQVLRIDSDGVIHARSVGNDHIPDGTVLRFKPEYASKLVSIKAPAASLEAVNFDADIPDFPEASDIQKRIFNNLGNGSIPAQDLDRIVGDFGLTPEDFAGELQDLEARGLVEIETGDKPRIRRADDADLGVVDVVDADIEDVPEDDTPDLEDSPNFTRAQRDLLDQIAAADRGEGDGVSEAELGDYNDDDLQALIEAGALDVDDRGNVYLENPEGRDQVPADTGGPEDLSAEIFDAAAALSDDPDIQDAFQHYAEELARPGEGDNVTLPEGLAPAKRRNAEAAANKWWNERNSGAAEGDVAETPEEVAPESAKPNPKDVLNPRNQGMADAAVEYFFNDDAFLDSTVGLEYRGAVKRLFDAEDLEENGFSDQAAAERDKAERALRRIDVPETDIAEWPDEVRNRRAGVSAPDTSPEAAPDVTPEDIPEAGVTVEPTWEDFSKALQEAGPVDEFYARLEQENQIAEGLGLDLHDSDAPWSWNNLAEGVGFRPAELMFNDSNGSLGEALAKDPAPFVRQYEDELLARFDNNPDGLGPEVMRLRQAGLIEDDGNGGWVITQAGQDRLGRGGATDGEAIPAQNPWVREGKNGLNLREVLHLENPEDWGYEERAIAAQDAAQAMWDAQQGNISPDDAYDIAAEGVRNGHLTQSDLDDIQTGIVRYMDINGEQWDNQRAIDYVGDDQFGANAAGSIAPDASPASSHPKHNKIVNQRPFNIEEFPGVTTEGKGLLLRNGEVVRIGQWYKANRGGGGDLLEHVGFYDQDLFPGWILGRNPDGKYKAVHVLGEGGEEGVGGLNLIPDGDLRAEQGLWAAQRRALAGQELDELDQFKAANKMFDGVPAEIGMMVERRAGGGKFQQGVPGIVARVVMDTDGNIKVYVARPGAKSQDDLVEVRVNMLRKRPETPTPPPTPTPQTPDLKDLNLDTNFVNGQREWPVPTDVELVDRLNQLGGEADMVQFVNAHENPGVVYNQINALIDAGNLELVPGQGNEGPRVRVPGGVPNVPEAALPEGAEDQFDAAVLNAIDAADTGGLQKADIVNLDDEDAGDKLLALRGLVERGVLRERTDPNGGRPFYERVVATPEPSLVNGAQNELEADILNKIDANGDVGAVSGDLVDIDAEDAADRMLALRSLVDRGVLQRTTDPDSGRPIYRRSPQGSTGSRTHDPSRGTNAGGQPMSHSDAVDALRAGADPMTVQTDNLYAAMKDSGRFEFRRLKNANVGETEWAVDRQVNGPHSVYANSPTDGRVYFVKRPNESNTRGNWRSELYAAAISQHVGASDGDLGQDEGRLYHPQTTSADRNRIIADHVGYNFPPGTKLGNLDDFSDRDLIKMAPDRIRLALYDFLINNSLDRHGKNQMYARLPDGSLRVIVIDNGLGDGENFGFDNPDSIDFDAFVESGGWHARTRKLLESVGRLNDGLTRADIRAIVESFARQYGSIDPAAILEGLIRNNSLDEADIAKMRTWLETAKKRSDSLSTNIDAIVNKIAAVMGI